MAQIQSKIFEIIKKDGIDGMKADAWTVAVIILIAITGLPLYKTPSAQIVLRAKYGASELKTYFKGKEVQRYKYYFSYEFLEKLSPLFKQPHERSQIADILGQFLYIKSDRQKKN